MTIIKPTRDPDYLWGQKSSGERPHHLAFWFYEMVAYDMYSEKLFKIDVKNGAVVNFIGNTFLPKIQTAYQEFIYKTEREIEDILVGEEHE